MDLEQVTFLNKDSSSNMAKSSKLHFDHLFVLFILFVIINLCLLDNTFDYRSITAAAQQYYVL